MYKFVPIPQQWFPNWGACPISWCRATVWGHTNTPEKPYKMITNTVANKL